jgi:hypothetical protein
MGKKEGGQGIGRKGGGEGVQVQAPGSSSSTGEAGGGEQCPGILHVGACLCLNKEDKYSLQKAP